MPLFSDLANLSYYYSGSTTSPYANHSSLGGGYTRTLTGHPVTGHSSYTSPALTSRSSPYSRNYQPLLATINESPLCRDIATRRAGVLSRVNSPKIFTHTSPKYKSTPKPICINTADIDVSSNKYKQRDRSKPPAEGIVYGIGKETEVGSTSPYMHRVDADDVPSNKSAIKRGRTVVRLSTIRGRDRHSSPVPATKPAGEESPERSNWRQNFSEDLELQNYKDIKIRKTPGEKLMEKHMIREKNHDYQFNTSDKTNSTPKYKKPDDVKPAVKKSSKRRSTKKTPTFHDICRDISSDKIHDDLNAGVLRKIVSRRASEELAAGLLPLNKTEDVISDSEKSKAQVQEFSKVESKPSDDSSANDGDISLDKSRKQSFHRRMSTKGVKKSASGSLLPIAERSVIVIPVPEENKSETVNIQTKKAEKPRSKIKKPKITTSVVVENAEPILKVEADVQIEIKPKKFAYVVVVEEIEDKVFPISLKDNKVDMENNKNHELVLEVEKAGDVSIDDDIEATIAESLKDITAHACAEDTKLVNDKNYESQFIKSVEIQPCKNVETVETLISISQQNVIPKPDIATKKESFGISVQNKVVKPKPESKVQSEIILKTKPVPLNVAESSELPNSLTFPTLNNVAERPVTPTEKKSSIKSDCDESDFWGKIGSRETIYYNARKKKLYDEQTEMRNMYFNTDTAKEGDEDNLGNKIEECTPYQLTKVKSGLFTVLFNDSAFERCKSENITADKLLDNQAHEFGENDFTITNEIGTEAFRDKTISTECLKNDLDNTKPIIIDSLTITENILDNDKINKIYTLQGSKSNIEQKLKETETDTKVTSNVSKCIEPKSKEIEPNPIPINAVIEHVDNKKCADETITAESTVHRNSKTEVQIKPKSMRRHSDRTNAKTTGSKLSVENTGNKNKAMHSETQIEELIKIPALREKSTKENKTIRKSQKTDVGDILNLALKTEEQADTGSKATSKPTIDKDIEIIVNSDDQSVTVPESKLESVTSDMLIPKIVTELTENDKILSKSTAEDSKHALPKVKPPDPAPKFRQLFGKNQPALKPLVATPRPLQKVARNVPKVRKEVPPPPPVHSDSDSSSEEEDDTSSGSYSETDSSTSDQDFFECTNKMQTEGLTKGIRNSTSSNDSGFDSAPGQDNVNLLIENSYTYTQYQKTARVIPPATTIPRFCKYAVDDFNFLKVLGKGSFGKVLLAELKNTEYYYAIKCLKKNVVLEDDDVECTLIERKVLALGTNHPYLCHLFCTFQTDSHLFFVMEYLNGGDLMFHIQQSGRFPETRARFYGAEIVSGLRFLHKKGIVYRDLKLDNILLDFDGHVRIADFGMCKLQIYLDRTADTFCGTPDYMAPEIIKGLAYNQSVDWWSFGVLLYEMLIGHSPFSGCDEDELFWSICNEVPSYPRYLSQEALTILNRFLNKNSSGRLGSASCPHGAIMDQPFFGPIDWDCLERRQLDPPFKPRVMHPLDTQYFDKAFTVERARLTPIDRKVVKSMDQERFHGFSYTNPNATN